MRKKINKENISTIKKLVEINLVLVTLEKNISIATVLYKKKIKVDIKSVITTEIIK